MLSALGTALVIVASVVVGIVALIMAGRRSRHRSIVQTRLNPPDRVNYSVDIPRPENEGVELYLSCPHCEFEGPLDDPALVGQTVDCPLCDQSFVVLEPESASTHPAGVK